MRRLDTEALPVLRESIPVPDYDRSQVRPSIVHLGVGGFHRAHEAMYLDRLMAVAKALEWGICGVGLMPGDRRMQEVLSAQDHLYTLVVKHPDGTLEPRVIGSIVDYLFAPDDYDAVIEKMAAEQTRIVSLTVTEGGYNVHSVTGEFDEKNADVQRDLAADAEPHTMFGLVCAALARRRERGLAPFTVMSCDNIQGNGDVAHKMFAAFARLRDPSFGEWVDSEVHFPNSMVDRITPATSDEDRDAVAELLQVRDEWPVVCEPFTQWALEDSFSLGRPPLEEVGVQLVDDVTPYELMKLRLLNASHQALCYLGYLSGYRYAHEVCQDPLFVDFLLGYMDDEATPTLEPAPGVDLPDYKRQLIERFANAEVRDTLARLCAESSDRIPKWLLPVIRSQLASGGSVERSALVVAAWARYAEGVDEQGEPIEVVDRLRDELIAAARSQHDDPDAFIANREVFGDLVEHAGFMAVYRDHLASLHANGAHATVKAVVAGQE
ncbi:MAG: mannitol dehydrogenase family protein [Actinomycetota bacterium]|nr:mannitol dehydrogenase family protein [Actinomycetota bacterium]